MVTTENGYTLVLQKQPLRTDIATVHGILIIRVVLNVQSYGNTFGG